MKNIKTKEELKKELELRDEFFRPGNYVLINLRSNQDDLNDFLKNNVGQILRQHITNDDIMIVIYENVPENLKSNFSEYDGWGKMIPKDRFIASSRDKEEIEEYIFTLKYNI